MPFYAVVQQPKKKRHSLRANILIDIISDVVNALFAIQKFKTDIRLAQSHLDLLLTIIFINLIEKSQIFYS